MGILLDVLTESARKTRGNAIHGGKGRRCVREDRTGQIYSYSFRWIHGFQRLIP
jgi:hypothetical protein